MERAGEEICAVRGLAVEPIHVG
jgi:hypothetical protein